MSHSIKGKAGGKPAPLSREVQVEPIGPSAGVVKGEGRPIAVLLERVYQARDEVAFTELYDRTAGHVFGFILTQMPEGPAAENVLQETFSEVWAMAEASPYSIKTGAIGWLMNIARAKACHQWAGPGTEESLYAGAVGEGRTPSSNETIRRLGRSV